MQVGRYTSFCGELGWDIWTDLPASLEAWVASLSKQGLSHKTVLAHISALRHHAKIHCPLASLDSDRLRLMLRGLKSEGKGRTSLKTPAATRHLQRLEVAAEATLDRASASRFVAMLAVGFYGFLRPSELCVSPAGHFLRRKDVSVSTSGRKCTLRLRSFKHSANPAKVVIREVGDRGPLPVDSLRAYLRTWQLDPAGPMFNVTTSDFRRDLEQVRLKARIKSKITPHSLRHGGASWAGARGWPDAKIKAHGRWNSDAYKTYVRGL